jgi:MarR family transcriptional regulator, organic hydroperoxide resistance regulator
MRWQRAVDAALRPLGLTHTQYLVLASVARAIRGQDDDAVAHGAIGDAAGLDPATICMVVRTLDKRGLVDRSNDGLDARRWRVMITHRGWSMLAKASVLVDATAAEVLDREKRS